MTRPKRVTVWEQNTRRPNPVPTCVHCGCWHIEHRIRHSADPSRRFACNHGAPMVPGAALSAQVWVTWVAHG